MLEFQRANPDFGAVGHNTEAEFPLPGCLESLLEKCILKNARRDKLAKVKKIVDKDPEVARVKRDRSAALKVQFESVCMRDVTTLQGTKDDIGEGGTGSTLGMDVFCDEMSDRGVAEDIKITATPNITGLFLPSVGSNLSWLDCKGAFATCQSGADTDTIDFEEFLSCLALCGTIKYENVKGIGGKGGRPGTCPDAGAEMPLAAIVDGIYTNFLGEKDSHAVVTEFQQPALPRYDYASSGADSKWINVYTKMDLSHAFGFPLWEKEVFEVLGANYAELKLIFQQYAKTGTAGSASAAQLFTMQKTELTNLSLDCSFANAEFMQTRVINIFERADQVDDTFQTSKKDKRVKTGTSAEGGDNGLELHEFLECIVMLAFARANPKYGQVGKSDPEKNDLDVLPGCLSSLLTGCILQKAKRDEAPKWLSEIVTSSDCRAAIDQREDELRMEWRRAAGKGQQGSQMTNKNMTDTGLTMSIDDFIADLLERGMMNDVTIPPRPPVVGMAVQKVALSLSALDIKGAFVTVQDTDTVGGASGNYKQGENKNAADALTMGNTNHQIGFEEFQNALALCGHVKYMQVPGATMAQRVAGSLDNYLGKKTERDVITAVLYPPPVRTAIADTAPALPGQPDELHDIFVTTWKEAMKGCLVIDVIGFPVWEEEVFKLVQKHYGELSAVFTHYAQSIAGGSLQKTTLLTVTMQDNELASFCRDAGLLTEQLTIARVQSLFKDVANAFAATKTTGKTASNGQGGGSGVYSEGIHMPAFIVLLLLIALNRANPKLGRVGEAGEAAVDSPIPDCFVALLEKHVLKKAKRSKMMTVKAEVIAADYKSVFGPSRAALEKSFNSACKKREKMPAVSLFSKFMMSRPTLIAELKDSGIIVQKQVKAKPKVTGDAAANLSLSLAPLDVEAAFTLCQDGMHGDAANDTIDFEEFLLALALCGAFKYSEVDMAVAQRVEAVAGEYVGAASADVAIAASAPKAARYDASASGGAPAFLKCWAKMDLSRVRGFPTWEEGVCRVLSEAFTDVSALFTYYAGDSPGMQQAELVDLVLDNNLPTDKYTITRIISLFESINKESGAGDADLELYEFLTFIVTLAFSRSAGGDGLAELTSMLAGLRRSLKIDELGGTLTELKADEKLAEALTNSAGPINEIAYKQANGGKPVGERAWLKYLEKVQQIRSVIVKLPNGSEGHTTLTWQDASAAFSLCGGGADLDNTSFAMALALCGAVKYRVVGSMTPAARFLGFLANVGNSKDEHAVITEG